MVGYISFSADVEAKGLAALSIINALNEGKEYRRSVFARHRIINPEPEEWYPLENWLAAFDEIARELGPDAMFDIGKSIVEKVKTPPQIDTLQNALGYIEMVHYMNYRGGEIGRYEMHCFTDMARKAVMECNNFYTSDFDLGIITGMVRKYKPNDSHDPCVFLDTSRPTRSRGGDSCTYVIHW